MAFDKKAYNRWYYQTHKQYWDKYQMDPNARLTGNANYQTKRTGSSAMDKAIQQAVGRGEDAVTRSSKKKMQDRKSVV